MVSTAWLAVQHELAVSGSFHESQVSDCCNVNSERKGVNHPNAYLIFMFTYQRVAHFCLCRPSAMHVQWLFLYLCSLRDPILSPSILGAPCIPGLTQGLWGLWAPSLLWALCISRTQFPTGQWSLWPHFSLWEVMQLGEFFNELLRDVAQKMKSHHNTIAFLSNYRSNNCKQQLALPSQASLTDLGPWEKV